jgi:hypothetical protein
MISFCILIGLVGFTAADLFWLNKKKEKQRVANGKPAKLKVRDIFIHPHH